MSANNERFQTELTAHYVQLFKLPEYAIARTSGHTPATLAAKMTEGLRAGSASKDGLGIKRTCKALGIKCTYAAIQEYLT